MKERRLAFRGGYVAAAVIVVLFACDDRHDHDNFRGDVISCEEALAHLADCCPGFDPGRVRCEYNYDEGCAGGSTQVEHPTLDSDESQCIRNLECSDLIERDVCTRAQNDLPYTGEKPSSSDAGGSRGPVCP
ncbi:hypothetical protein LZC95_07665 [Pendulispora brunnea]|uniref:Lipoprotein n=1 Tax=Pendulispora brunnea TaxID=2905690 RepID=A0ABZ2KK24_9BACT